MKYSARKPHSQSIPLSATSSLVLLLSHPENYPSRQAQQYMKMLDLKAGKKLHKQCKTIWPRYEQVITNRKFAVSHLIKQCRQKNKDLNQMVVFGAGLAPLSIETVVCHPGLRVFDIDAEQMPLKKRLLDSLNDSSLSAISCLTADLRDLKSVHKQLIDAQWKPDKPTIAILEGISYYLSSKEIQSLINLFKNQQKNSRIILEHLLPFENVSEERRNIPEQIFQLIENACGLACVTKLKSSKIASWPGFTILKKLSMHDVEKMRTGSNKHFPAENSGWIEICLFAC